MAEYGESSFSNPGEQMVDSIFPVDTYFKAVFCGFADKLTRESPVPIP